MGIRMHLKAGYGLDLNVLGDLRADRSRLKYEVLEDEELFAAWKKDVIAFSYRADNAALMERMIFHEDMNPPRGLYELVTYDDEFGDANKLLLQPAGSRENWSRYGNLLDAFLYESDNNPNDSDWMETEWTEKPGTVYPYVGLMRVAPVSDEHPLGVEKYQEPCFLDSEEHRNAVPWAPWHLWFLIKHLALWPEDKTTEIFLSLRPTIYRYWS